MFNLCLNVRTFYLLGGPSELAADEEDDNGSLRDSYLMWHLWFIDQVFLLYLVF